MATARVLLLDRLAADMEGERQRYHSSPAQAKMQTRDVISSNEKDGKTYESTFRRLYKYFLDWKSSSEVFSSPSHHHHHHPSPSSFTTLFPSKIRTLVSKQKSSEYLFSDKSEKMGTPSSKEDPTISKSSGEIPHLPLEIQIQILQNLTWKEQVRLASVCKTWRSVIIDWIVPQDFRSPTGNTVLGPHIVNPLLEQLRCELGSSVLSAETMVTEKGESILDQPLCYPSTTHLILRVSDLRTDGLEPAVDDCINVFSNRCCDRNVRIRDALTAMDKFYRQVNEYRVIGDYKSWRSWKFLLETNRWWRRGFVGLCGKWEWKDGRYLIFFVEKIEGAWERDFTN
ncbi:hypothetical protein EYR41_007400 [Orbilia oligospora]|uniref:F-box domain-containing protein n=1 Tax=Orbilia oligospora TaxID=2813651 RepID=A0A8H2DWG3_ORBOL|nr:hypothetical protein EYR41_007400 [Orbilia oligospora]